MKQSNFLSLGWRDMLRSFLVAFFTFLAYFAQDFLLPALNFPVEVKAMVSAAIGYLIKNFLTKPDNSKKIIGGRSDER